MFELKKMRAEMGGVVNRREHERNFRSTGHVDFYLGADDTSMLNLWKVISLEHFLHKYFSVYIFCFNKKLKYLFKGHRRIRQDKIITDLMRIGTLHQ